MKLLQAATDPNSSPALVGAAQVLTPNVADVLASTLAAPAYPVASLGQPLDPDLVWLGGANALALDGLGVG
jgi:hypothetical protein